MLPALVLVICGSVLLSWVALFNRAPLVFSDSVTYASTAWGFGVPEYFSIFYGAFIALLHEKTTLWPVPFVQGAILAHLVYLKTRSVSGRKFAVVHSLGILALLSLASALPWVSGQILPDAFTSVVVLGIFLLAFFNEELRPAELFYVLLLTSAAISFHLSHVPLALGLVIIVAIMKLAMAGRQGPQRRWAALTLSPLVLAVCGLMAVNWISSRQIGLARGSDVFLLARLIDRGPALSYLEEACPAAGYSLCAYLGELKGLSHDDLKWTGKSPFRKLGGSDVLQPEARRIVRATLIARPADVFAMALHDVARQAVMFRTGDGLSAEYADMFARHVEPMFGARVAGDFFASRQAQGTLPIFALRPLHTVAIGAGVILCCWFAITGVWRRERPDTLLHVFVLSSLVLSAIATGVLAGPYDRYLARIAWLVPFAAMLGVVVTFRQRPGAGEIGRRVPASDGGGAA